LKSVIFVPKRAPLGKLTQMMLFGATVISVDGDYKMRSDCREKPLPDNGWYNRNAAINPHLVEGKKPSPRNCRATRFPSRPDWVAVSVGDGCTVAGVYKGFYDFWHWD
jgi:threonine synthase